MSLIKQLAKETAIYGISSILVRLLPFAILTPYLTREFPPGEYGIISLVYAWTALLVVFFTYRMETTFFRFGSESGRMEKAFSTASLSLFFTTVVFALLLLSVAPFLSQLLLKNDEHVDLIILFVSIVSFDALTAIPFARLRLEKRPIRFAAIKTVNILINLFAVFFFLWACPLLIESGWTFLEAVYDAENRVSYVFWANLIASVATFLFFVPMYGKMQFSMDLALWKRMIYYTLPLVVVGIAGVINQLAGNPMIEELASDDYAYNFTLVGRYGALAKIAVFMNLYTQAFNYAAEPFFFSNAHRKDALQNYADVAKLFTILGTLVFLGIWSYLDIIKYFIGEAFHEGVELVPILLLAYLFLGLYYNFSIWYKLTDQTKYGGWIAVGGSVITLGLNYLLIPIPGISYFGPAWAALACYFSMAAIAYWLGRKRYPVPYPIGRMIGYILLALAFFLVSFSLQTRLELSAFSLLLINTVLLFVYVAGILIWERSFLKRILGRPQ